MSKLDRRITTPLALADAVYQRGSFEDQYQVVLENSPLTLMVNWRQEP